MTTTFAFDVYGTLIDTAGVSVQLEKLIGNKAISFSGRWRDKQLEYSFRRGLMQDYENFAVCTKDALDHTDAVFQTALTQTQKQLLLDSYRVLPAFDDVVSSLELLQKKGARMFAFSNGAASAVEGLLKNAEIQHFFVDIVSTDEIQSFKPNPAVYQHFLSRAGSKAEDTWLISSNPFDVLGSLTAGFHSAWLQRSATAIFDPWGTKPKKPSTVIHSLSDLHPLA